MRPEAVPAGVADIEERIETALRNAMAALTAARDNWAGLTAAQKDTALRLDTAATVGLLRLALRQFDSE